MFWTSQPDPFAGRPLVVWSQSKIAEWTNLSVRTVGDCLRDLKALEAISKVELASGAVGYYLNRHRGAETDARLGPFAPMDTNRVADPPASASSTSQRRKSTRPRFPAGVEPSEVAAILECGLDLPELKWDGPQVRSAGEAMVEYVWDPDDLAAVCRRYTADTSEDKPPARELFYARHRRATVERYWAPPAVPAVSRPPQPTLTRDQWVDYFAVLAPRDEAERLVQEHGEAITTMGPKGVKRAVMAWKAQPTRPKLASIFAESA